MALAPPTALPDAAIRWLTRHSITVLRVCVGTVFLVFGVMKFQPGASPAEGLARQTVTTLTLHVIDGHAAVLLTAEFETFIGLTLITSYWLRAGLAVMCVSLIGILSPLVLFPHELFGHGVTLLGQYVFKDIVLVAAGMVIAAHAHGAKLTVPGPAPAHPMFESLQTYEEFLPSEPVEEPARRPAARGSLWDLPSDDGYDGYDDRSGGLYDVHPRDRLLADDRTKSHERRLAVSRRGSA